MFSNWLLEQGRDDDVVLIDGDRRYTYADLRDAVASIVAELAALGVWPGAHIALIGPNSFFWVAGYLAALRVGVVVPLADKLAPEELAGQIEFATCTVVLADRRVNLSGLPGALPLVTDDVVGHAAPVEVSSVEADAQVDAALMFTSGTTSRPKAVRLTHANLIANTRSIVEYLHLERADRMLVILPFHYVFGASLLHTHLAVGASLVLCHTFTYPETAVKLIEDEACTGLAGVPSSYQLLLKASSYESHRLPSLRVVQQAGGRLSAELILRLAEAQPASKVYVMYGQTEATARLSYLPPELLTAKVGSIGRGIPGVKLEVVDSDGRPVGPGEHGEIVASGANISPGYYRDAAATAEKFRDGRLHTGDIATVDDDGFISIVGRSGDFIKSWGYRISPQHVEETALRHAGIADAVAVGIPDEDAGEALHLVVRLVPGSAPLEPREISQFLRGHLARHMLPVSVRVVDEMPTTASGKVARGAVRTLFAGQGPVLH